MSYQEGMGIPMLSVTGIVGALGSTNLTCGICVCRCMAAPSHPWFVSPSPWMGPMNVAVWRAASAGSMVT